MFCSKFRFNPDSQCIHLLKSFMFRKHTCLVTELLGASVFDFLKSNSYKPFNFVEIQSFARQMLDSIGCLHKNGITHTDLKPENILLVDDDAAETRNEAVSIDPPSLRPTRVASPTKTNIALVASPTEQGCQDAPVDRDSAD